MIAEKPVLASRPAVAADVPRGAPIPEAGGDATAFRDTLSRQLNNSTPPADTPAAANTASDTPAANETVPDSVEPVGDDEVAAEAQADDPLANLMAEFWVTESAAEQTADNSVSVAGDEDARPHLAEQVPGETTLAVLHPRKHLAVTRGSAVKTEDPASDPVGADVATCLAANVQVAAAEPKPPAVAAVIIDTSISAGAATTNAGAGASGFTQTSAHVAEQPKISDTPAIGIADGQDGSTSDEMQAALQAVVESGTKGNREAPASASSSIAAPPVNVSKAKALDLSSRPEDAVDQSLESNGTASAKDQTLVSQPAASRQAAPDGRADQAAFTIANETSAPVYGMRANKPAMAVSGGESPQTSLSTSEMISIKMTAAPRPTRAPQIAGDGLSIDARAAGFFSEKGQSPAGEIELTAKPVSAGSANGAVADSMPTAAPVESFQTLVDRKGGAEAAPATPGSLHRSELGAPVGQLAWHEELGQKLTAFLDRNIGTAELKLNPAHLGPLAVTIKLDQDGASVHFTSAHAPVREAIEAAVPRLREMLGSQQLNVTDVSVAAPQQNAFQSADQQSAFGFQQQARSGFSGAPAADAQQGTGEVSGNEVPPSIAPTPGQLNLYA